MDIDNLLKIGDMNQKEETEVAWYKQPKTKKAATWIAVLGVVFVGWQKRDAIKAKIDSMRGQKGSGNNAADNANLQLPFGSANEDMMMESDFQMELDGLDDIIKSQQ